MKKFLIFVWFETLSPVQKLQPLSLVKVKPSAVSHSDSFSALKLKPQSLFSRVASRPTAESRSVLPSNLTTRNSTNMSKAGFSRPKDPSESSSSPNLYVANCGPAVGLTYDAIKSAFQSFGEVVAVHPADESGVRTIVCFAEIAAAQEAFEAWNEKPCPSLADRVLHIRYSVPRPQKVRGNDSILVSHSAKELSIPGIHLVHEFISLEEEKELLKAVDEKPWKSLSKRRIQHYGYEFFYETRNVDSKQFLGGLPSFVSNILHKIHSFPGLGDISSKLVDQLTVNEYPPGVGLSPHIDTHSAFDDLIFSLSLAGPCIMEFRKYNDGNWNPQSTIVTGGEGLTKSAERSSNVTRKAVFLPPRSMLLMSGEGRYAWHHYIPHHKIDIVGDRAVKRGSRRVSFTFRKVRKGPCQCIYRQFCDSQLGLEKDAWAMSSDTH